MRLDKLLAGQMGSRARAQDAIKAGRVQVSGKTVTKSSLEVADASLVTILPADEEFVSRAGAKLKKAVDECGIDLQGQVVLDIGASTGGFTDVCLQQGASKVYALDVGHLQLAQKLDKDPRVVKMEGFNARDLKAADLSVLPDFICMDVSFISARSVLEPVLAQLPVQHLALLVKPQFECGPAALNKHGVLRDDRLRNRIIQDMKIWLLQYFSHVRIVDDVLAGRSGNREAMLYAWERRKP